MALHGISYPVWLLCNIMGNKFNVLECPPDVYSPPCTAQRTFIEVYRPKSAASAVQKLLAGARHVVALTLDQKVGHGGLLPAYRPSVEDCYRHHPKALG